MCVVCFHLWCGDAIHYRPHSGVTIEPIISWCVFCISVFCWLFVLNMVHCHVYISNVFMYILAGMYCIYVCRLFCCSSFFCIYLFIVWYMYIYVHHVHVFLCASMPTRAAPCCMFILDLLSKICIFSCYIGLYTCVSMVF